MGRSSQQRDVLLIAILAFALASVIPAVSSASGARRHLLAPTDIFPPGCNCERSLNKSPYRLSLDAPASDGGFNKYCFTVANVAGCDPASTCCNGQQGVNKLEFEVASDCKASLKKVTVDGAPSFFEYNTAKAILRVTGLNKTAAAAPGTKVCLYLKADLACNSLNQLCTAVGGACKYAIFNQGRDCCPVGLVSGVPPPPPPSPQPPSFSPIVPGGRELPPPPPGAFPHCQCEGNPKASTLSASLQDVTQVGGLTRACFRVNVNSSGCLLGSKCCEFDLNKFELDANPTCSSSLVYTTLDGVKKVRFFQQSPYPMVKVTNINKPFSQVNGTEICLFLRAPCDSLDSLCPGGAGKCTIALFNPRSSKPSCCPLSVV